MFSVKNIVTMTNTPVHDRFFQGRTAFLLIHGIGQQNPFETLDYFAQNFVRYFEQQNIHIRLEHLIARRRLDTGAFWTESFLRLSPRDTTQDWFVDIHEYYWAPDTENKITVPEIMQWAEQTLDGTIDFYSRKNNQDLLENLLQHQVSKHSLFKFRLRSLTIFLRLFNLFYPVLRLGVWLILSLLSPFFKGRLLGSAWKLSKALVTPPLVDFVGDIAIYTKINPRSPYYKIRQQVIRESLTLLQEIMQDQQADYNQVILAGHSLGSCIAYDTLNLLCIEASLAPDQGKSMLIDKLSGLITFGSPLDKIAFFFQETARENQYIRKRILEHLNSFRVKPKSTTELVQQRQYFSCNPVVCQLNQLRWFNYYHTKDPISGNLDYYDNLNNIELRYPASWGNQGHLGYWNDIKFYEHIANQFLYVTQQD
jgi:hypothetical protein